VRVSAIKASFVARVCVAARKMTHAFDIPYGSAPSRRRRSEMMYRIEYQDLTTSGYCWNGGEESYPSSHEAQRAIHDLLALGGAWSRCAYRVRPIQKTAPTHAELARFVEQLGNEGVEFAFWSGEDGSEAVLFEEDEIATAVPGGPVRRGWVFDRPINAVVRELVAGDHEAVVQARAAAVEAQAVQERERAAAAAQQRAAAQERERAAAAAVEAQQRAAAQERERAAAAAVEAQQRAAAQERQRVATQERERAEAHQRALAAAEERERVAAVEAKQRAAALERERAVAIEAERRTAALERERAAALEAQLRAAAVDAQQRAAVAERERAVAIEAQQRAAAALAREHAAAVERERAAAEAKQHAAKQERERAAAMEAQRRAAAQERERVASLQPSVEATRARSAGPVAIPQSIAAAVQRPPLARVAGPQSDARVPQGSPLAGAARSAFVPQIPTSSNLDSEGELVALTRLLRCGAWREGLRANDLLTAEQLPPGARRAIQELVGTATPNVRALGNALKRVQDKRVEGVALKLKRKIDNHGFAIWQVVNDAAATSMTAEDPGKTELLRGALTGMGFRLADANHAISTLRDCIETDSLAELVRKALAVLRQRPSAGSEGKRK
jgi:hypothetical protein